MKTIKRGLSLVVLVITIIVLSILATVIIMNLSGTGLIDETSKTVLKSDLLTLQDLVSLYTTNHYEEIDDDQEYTIYDFKITEDTYTKYESITVIKSGKLFVKPNATDDIKDVARELNILIEGAVSNTGHVVADKAITDLRIYGNSVQNGIPSSSNIVPIKSVGDKSKNLIDYSTFQSRNQTAYPLTISNGSLTYNGNYYIEADASFLECGKTYTFDCDWVCPQLTAAPTWRFYYSDGTYSRATSFGASLTVKDTSAPSKIYLYVNFESTVRNITYTNLQLVEGTNTTNYEPYWEDNRILLTMTGKNMLPYPYYDTTKTTNGITFTDNGDGTITINGTATSDATFILQQNAKYGSLIDGEETGTNGNYAISTTNNQIAYMHYDDSSKIVSLNVNNGTTVNNLLFKPQIEYGETATGYEQYIEKTYSIYLEEPLRKLGNIADYIDCKTGEIVRYITEDDTTGTKSIEESFEVLDTPTMKTVSVGNIDFTGVKHIYVNTKVTPSNIEAKY